jgi:hypothetical protein
MAETPSHPDLRAILAGCKMSSQDGGKMNSSTEKNKRKKSYLVI